MEKILIVNAVALNNGDAALVVALFDALKERGCEVKIATHKFDLVKAMYPSMPYVRDVLDYKVLKKARFLKYILIPFFVIFSKHYREADIIIGAPGGYINSNYAFIHKLFTMLICKILGKKISIYSQSIGPLNRSDGMLLKLIIPFIDLLFVRDEFSFNTLKLLHVKMDKVFLTEDAAFLLKPISFDNYSTKRIAVSVRDWGYDNRNLNKYYEMVANLVKKSIEQGYFVDFLSTCQGIKGYVDDSKVANKILKYLPLNCYCKIKIIDTHFDLFEFRKRLIDYDFVIGTRLHMCILSMLNDTPAFNISYEVKGKECFIYLGLQNFSIDYNDDVENALSSFSLFINKQEYLKENVKKIIKVKHSKAKKFFSFFVDHLKINCMNKV